MSGKDFTREDSRIEPRKAFWGQNRPPEIDVPSMKPEVNLLESGGDMAEPPGIRVAHVVMSLEPGGMENGVVNLCRSLDRRRFSSAVICLARRGEFVRRLQSDTEVVCLEKKEGFEPLLARRMARVIADLRADVVHTHNLGPLFYAMLAKRFFGLRAAIVQGEHAELRPDEKTRRRRVMRSFGYRSCQAIHTVSNGLREEILEFGATEDKVVGIPNGVDCERFAPGDPGKREECRRELGIEPGEFVVGMVGRFGAFKRHLELIESFESLASRLPRLRLLMIGDHGPKKGETLAAMERSVVRDRITWLGFLEDPAPLYRVMDLLAIPSENEGLSNAMLEAMASGVPCLANPACGAGEVLQDEVNGFLKPMPTPRAIADEIESILQKSDLDLQNVRHAARETVLESHSLSFMVRQYEDLYESALLHSRS